MTEEEVEAIVIDNGSGLIKAGYSGEDGPRSVFPTITGTIKDPEAYVNQFGGRKMESRDTFVGSAAQEQREFLAITYPIERGKINDWNLMEKIWDYTFSTELRLNPEVANMPVLVTDAPLDAKANRDHMAQIMFEVFKVPGFYVSQQCVLSLYASGRTRGIVVETGYGASHAVPIFEGYALPHAILRLDVAGNDITHYLRRVLAKNGHNFAAHDINIVEDIKEKHCYLGSQQGSDTPVEASDKPYELPDGSIIEISQECRIRAPEVLFDPSLLGESHPSARSPGIVHMVKKSISMCDRDLQRDLYGAIVLAGGTSMLPGLAHRMYTEISTDCHERIRVVPDFQGRERGYNSQRKYASWVGGSMFASLSTFSQIQITKQEWEEYHDNIVHRKCF